jgi:zinc D-Ala-D-Ala carboxypeptidase
MRLSFKIRKRLVPVLTAIFTALFVISLGSQIISKPNLANSQDQNPTTPPISSLPNRTQVAGSAIPSPTSQLKVIQTPVTPQVVPPSEPIVSQAAISSPSNAENPLNFSVESNPSMQARGTVQYGHFPYAEAEPGRLVEVGKFVRDTYTRSEALDFDASQAFQQMRDAARAAGVAMMPISGFRNVADQQELFDRQTQRRGSAKEAARYSAPPGHSEHHTGYALDITDERRSDVDLKVAFDETDVYRWLSNNARQFGFQQSFPANNAQGVSYEPWHWRFVGSPQAQAVFAAARGQ